MPKIDYLPPNNIVFIDTIKPIITTKVTTVGNMKSGSISVCLYAKYVNIIINNV